MIYGYFKNRDHRLYIRGLDPLRVRYDHLKAIPNIIIFYDYIKSGIYINRLLNKLNKNDTLYITHISDLGKTNSMISNTLEKLKTLEVEIYIFELLFPRKVLVNLDRFDSDSSYYLHSKYVDEYKNRSRNKEIRKNNRKGKNYDRK